MQRVDERDGGEAKPANPDRRADLRVSAPALDAAQQPGFKVLEEDPPLNKRKFVWTLIAVLVAIAAGYYFYLR